MDNVWLPCYPKILREKYTHIDQPIAILRFMFHGFVESIQNPLYLFSN